MMQIIIGYILSNTNCLSTINMTRIKQQMLLKCWVSLADAGPTLKQHWDKVSCDILYFSVPSIKRIYIIICFIVKCVHVA